MSNLLAELPQARTALLCAVPLFYLAAAVSPGCPWVRARWGSTLAASAALVSLVWLLASGPALVRGPELVSLGHFGALHASVRSDAVGSLMLVLVSFIGWVLVRYSQSYLQGEKGQPRYVRGLLLTLAAVTALVATNNLLLLVGAWIATSLSLHGLLTFFAERPQALIAAHKKFLASRVADLCLLGGVALMGHVLGTFEIDQAIAAARALPDLPGALQVAAVLLAASALLKCAQLPVHGWLIQVMEAPTPVSALLHAGVVNLGGFLLIRLGSLVGDVPAAQALLVVMGSITAVVAALVMMTRISIKVSLAWSTCAQMGFMLMQCGLGLYELALLHLLAHSLYKAHAFLAAGGAVEQNRLRQMTPPLPALSFSQWLGGGALGLLLVAGAALAWGFSPGNAPGLWAVGAVLCLALAPLLAGPVLRGGGLWPLAGLMAGFAVALTYFGLHAWLGHWLGDGAMGAAPPAALVGWVIGCFGLLFVVQGVVRAQPHAPLARGLYPWMFAGFYLDEAFTRLTFRLWPARVPVRPRPGQVAPSTVPQALADANHIGAI